MTLFRYLTCYLSIEDAGLQGIHKKTAQNERLNFYLTNYSLLMMVVHSMCVTKFEESLFFYILVVDGKLCFEVAE